MRTVSGFQHYITLPAGLAIKRMTAAGGFLYMYCDDVTGGEASMKISTGEDSKGHIEQMFRIEARHA